MKINQKILSIPPFISTSWKNVISLRSDQAVLFVELLNGSVIEVPGLDLGVMQSIFEAHEKFMEQEIPATQSQVTQDLQPEPNFNLGNGFSLPLQLSIEGSMGNMLQHSPEASHSPNLPPEVLDKISTLARVVGLEGMDNFPKAEPHCNCMHCQLMRAIHMEDQENPQDEAAEEEVSDEDLTFRDWEIKQTADNLYLVSNPIIDEHFNVFLGDSIGCTCGENNCEHIRAVLNS